MRFFRLFVILCCIIAVAMPADSEAARKRKGKRSVHRAAPVLGVKDPRYAAVIMDPKTGEVLHQQNADSRRFPASLTKMMTLYLLFEELEKGEISLDDDMDVSSNAAVQPETNINLESGDEVPVELAIKAMVVRSANDVSVVIAEELGGSEQGFARLMNAKAAALGMRNTHFKNPNGLPDAGQYTTAKDMAKLGIALKRDFPQYYPYFSTREFSWNGVSYFTHNRVMLRYSGVDGIKTGYIGKSGFNVVSSVVRGGRPLIGVVMGGGTGRWRDDKMIELLSGGYTKLASRGQQRGTIYAQNLPRSPLGEETTVAQAATSDAAVRSADTFASVEADRGIIQEEQKEITTAASPTTRLPDPDIAVKAPVPKVITTTPTKAQVLVLRPASGGKDTGWGIQVGAYASKLLAEKAAKQAQLLASPNLKGSKILIGAASKTAIVHRARLENLSENQAKTACNMLISKNSPCFIYKSGTQNL